MASGSARLDQGGDVDHGAAVGRRWAARPGAADLDQPRAGRNPLEADAEVVLPNLERRAGGKSVLVFTNKVELLKLAVIVALWAAIIAAFISFIYRRQADIDQARARDLKLVYDLQSIERSWSA